MIVKAKDETIAKYIWHPTGMKFLPDGTSDWPMDAFTKRRIRAGDVFVVTPEQQRRAEEAAAKSTTAVKPAASDRHDITR
jgi:hypothetical protein